MLLHKQEFASCGNSVHKFRMLMQELLPWLCINFQDLQCEMSVHASTCAFCMLTAHGRTSIGSLFTLQFYLLTIQVSEVDARSIVTINFSNLQCEHMLQDDASASSDTKWYKNTHIHITNTFTHTHTATGLQSSVSLAMLAAAPHLAFEALPSSQCTSCPTSGVDFCWDMQREPLTWL